MKSATDALGVAGAVNRMEIAGDAFPQPEARSGRVRVGIVGAGYIATYHLAVLRQMGTVEVVGACDPNAERLEAICREWQVPYGARSLGELVRICRPEVVHVLVPPPYHFSVAEEAL